DHQVYENLRAQPRVWLVGEVQVVRDWYQQLQRLRGEIKDEQGRAFDPRRMAMVDWVYPKKFDSVDWQGIGLSQGAAEPFAPESAKILSRQPGSLEIETDAARPSLLVISEMAYPGWQAAVDGQPVNWQRANHMLCGVPLTAGKHRVTFRYRPSAIKIGAMVSLTTALVLLSVIWFDWRKRR
ncbi:MAG: YfhO family protein, partial [Acidobacteria bacterium]|nr:YfhO family protein [Acidobacteriota bacterium]